MHLHSSPNSDQWHLLTEWRLQSASAKLSKIAAWFRSPKNNNPVNNSKNAASNCNVKDLLAYFGCQCGKNEHEVLKIIDLCIALASIMT